MTSTGFVRRVVALTAMAVAVLTTAVPAGPSTAQEPPGPVAVTEAPPLTWGFKTSWRNYAGPPEVADGAAVVGTGGSTYDLTWAFEGGTFDATTGTTVLRYEGSVHWAKYPLRDFPDFVPPGYAGSLDVPILDVTIADPVITISRDRSDIVVDAVSRTRSTMALDAHPDSTVARLDVDTVTPVVDATTTTWPAIDATGGPGVTGAFDGMYQPGQAIDPVSFAYTGPGGAPDFSEVFDAPGTVRLAPVDSEILVTDPADASTLWWYDETRQITHWRRQDPTTFAQVHYAFSLETMSVVGEPWVLSSSDPALPTVVRFTDPGAGRAYYASGTSLRWVEFDVATGTYRTGDLAQPFPRVGNSYAWDAVGDRAVNISKVVPPGAGPTDFDAHVWTVFTYAETDPGTWVRSAHALPGFPTGLNRDGYLTSATATSANMAALPDGSLVVLGTRQRSSDPGVPAPTTFPGAYRIVLGGDGTATAQPIAGTDIPASEPGFERILTGPDGELSLVTVTGARVQQLRWDATGGTVTAEPVVEVLGRTIGAPQHHAVDRAGTLWLDGGSSKALVGIDDGRIVADQLVPDRHPRGGWIFAGPDGSVYALANDGSTDQTISGIGRYERLGTSPTVTTDPQDAAVTLAVGEDAEAVELTSTATGTPEPERQWQVKAPGSARFADIGGETGETLTVEAAPGMDGSRYRAVYANAAGRAASEAATLSVHHAPIVSFQPLDASVIEGEDASFDVEQSATPAAEVTWQRAVGGFWHTIGPDDDGIALDGGRITITDTNVDQSGARFRARIRNGVGTVHTRTATLTVAERSDGPQHVVGGELDWGVRESFRTYITGPIAHGRITVDGGATVDTDGTFVFPAGTGEVQGDAIDAAFAGAVHFTGHEGAGTAPGVPALDMRIGDVRVAVDGEDGTLVADVVSRGLSDGAVTVYDDVAFADLDLSAVSPTPVEGGLRWTSVPATLTTAGVPAFADFYPAGDPLDPLTVTLVLSDEPPEPPEEPRTAVESFVTAALADLLATEPTDEQVAAGVTRVEAVGKARYLRELTASDAWLGAIVHQLYQDTLGRPAEPDEVAYWVGRLRSGWSVARVAATFRSLQEYDDLIGGTDEAWVTALYRTLLDRAPEPGGLAYWLAEARARGRGAVALRFYQSGESARTRVTGLYRTLLDRAPEPDGLAFWAPRVVARGDLVLAVELAASAEYQARAATRYP